MRTNNPRGTVKKLMLLTILPGEAVRLKTEAARNGMTMGNYIAFLMKAKERMEAENDRLKAELRLADAKVMNYFGIEGPPDSFSNYQPPAPPPAVMVMPNQPIKGYENIDR